MSQQPGRGYSVSPCPDGQWAYNVWQHGRNEQGTSPNGTAAHDTAARILNEWQAATTRATPTPKQ